MLFCVLFFIAHETPLSNKKKIILPIIIKIIIIITIVITLIIIIIIIILAFKSFED